jgi:hypothetical protein
MGGGTREKFVGTKSMSLCEKMRDIDLSILQKKKMLKLYGCFSWLLEPFQANFLHAHREASILAGELPEESEQFRFLRAS